MSLCRCSQGNALYLIIPQHIIQAISYFGIKSNGSGRSLPVLRGIDYGRKSPQSMKIPTEVFPPVSCTNDRDAAHVQRPPLSVGLRPYHRDRAPHTAPDRWRRAGVGRRAPSRATLPWKTLRTMLLLIIKTTRPIVSS